jgi:hypothetical protein
MRLTLQAKLGVLAAGLSLWPGVSPVSAHHSFAAEYDEKKPVKVTGIVRKVEWTNPHSRMYLDVKDANGAVTVWNFEFGSPNHLFRAGWSRNTVKEGDQITIEGWGAKDGSRLAQTREVILADGRKVPGFAGGGDSGGAPAQPQ